MLGGALLRFTLKWLHAGYLLVLILFFLYAKMVKQTYATLARLLLVSVGLTAKHTPKRASDNLILHLYIKFCVIVYEY